MGSGFLQCGLNMTHCAYYSVSMAHRGADNRGVDNLGDDALARRDAAG
jgi:hypothetical protein